MSEKRLDIHFEQGQPLKAQDMNEIVQAINDGPSVGYQGFVYDEENRSFGEILGAGTGMFSHAEGSTSHDLNIRKLTQEERKSVYDITGVWYDYVDVNDNILYGCTGLIEIGDNEGNITYYRVIKSQYEYVEGVGACDYFNTDSPIENISEVETISVIGYFNNETTGFCTHAEGLSTKARNECDHAEGAYTTASGYYSHAEGAYTNASGNSSHAEGDSTVASGYVSHAEGLSTKARNQCDHAEGAYTTASGQYSHAEGNVCIAEGNSSHAEGYNSQTSTSNNSSNTLSPGGYSSAGYYTHAEGNACLAEGNSSHAEGKKTFAKGGASHAEGGDTTASGDCSHAEGGNTSASGYASHAEGSGSEATNEFSHAEGNGVHATGPASHAEGSVTWANGNNSHAEGIGTIANGWCSHTEGDGTETSDANSCEHAEGRFNASHTGEADAQKTRHSIGIGSDPSHRANAFEVMANGDVYINGVGGYDGTNPSEAKTIQESIHTIKTVTVDDLSDYATNYHKSLSDYGLSASDVQDFIDSNLTVRVDTHMIPAIASVFVPTILDNVSTLTRKVVGKMWVNRFTTDFGQSVVIPKASELSMEDISMLAQQVEAYSVLRMSQYAILQAYKYSVCALCEQPKAYLSLTVSVFGIVDSDVHLIITDNNIVYLKTENGKIGSRSQIHTLIPNINHTIAQLLQVSDSDIENMAASTLIQTVYNISQDPTAMEQLPEEYKEMLTTIGVNIEAMATWNGLSSVSDFIAYLQLIEGGGGR